MAEFPDDPEELQLHYATVWAIDKETWKPEIDYPDWMSPYEAAAMLRVAALLIERDLLDLVKESDEGAEGDDE